MKPLKEDTQRLWDLVRYQRAALYTAELITNDEYAELAQDHAAVRRLEGYDRQRVAVTCLHCLNFDEPNEPFHGYHYFRYAHAEACTFDRAAADVNIAISNQHSKSRSDCPCYVCRYVRWAAFH